MKIIGLTGGSGAGKTTAAAVLGECGFFTIDCDRIAHEVIMPEKEAYKRIVSFFGDAVVSPDKTINRRILGEIVFSDRQKLRRLEEITHFYIKQEVLRLIEKAREENAAAAVIDAPLLVQTGLDRLCDEIWLVYAKPEVRLGRLAKRDGLDEKQLRKRLENQTGFEELKKTADVVIDTGSIDMEEMKNIIIKYAEKYKGERICDQEAKSEYF